MINFKTWLAEVVVRRRMTPAEKKARDAYLRGHNEKLAHAETSIKKDKVSFKDLNTQTGDYSKQPSHMRHIGLHPKKNTI